MKNLSNKSIRVINDFNKMKNISNSYIVKGDWEHALRTIFIACGFMYTMNQIQYDADVENMVNMIAQELIPNPENYYTSEKTVLYYDSFGNVERGLSKIYLDALNDLGFDVKYVTVQYCTKSLKILEERLGIENVFCIQCSSYEERMRSLARIIEQSHAQCALLYMTPDDVAAAGVFSIFKGKIQRLMINLTDHAFWIGRDACDIVVNFREFGGKVCKSKRNFAESQIAYLPYYPDEIKSDFQELPFSDNSRKLIFSGGALYKTESIDNKYFQLVERLLTEYPDTNFMYLGNGDSKKIRQFVNKYPGRAFFATERSDFFEVMKRCTIYLSTYPYNGGMMTQYALLAKKIPITLMCPGIDRELSILNEKSFWNYTSLDACVEEVGKLLNDDIYRRKKEKSLTDFLISQNQFTKELQYLLINGVSKRQINYNNYEFDGFSRFPLEKYSGIKYYRLFFRKNGIFMLRFFPVQYFLGGLETIKEKIYKSI